MVVTGLRYRSLLLFMLIIISPVKILAAVAPNTSLAWQGQDISALITGGVDTGYSKPTGQGSSFYFGDFNPVFLFSYDDILLFRSSLSFTFDNQANTDTSLDFANLNWFINDYVTFGFGKFDSALGQFTQNLSATWVNKLPSLPVGFDSNQAAPQSDIGIQLRGGLPLSTLKANYIFYVANGPEAMVDTMSVIPAIVNIATDGFSGNNTGNYVMGGRAGFLPTANFEIGISAATGQLVLIDMADGITQLQNRRNYDALGADVSYRWNNWSFYGEIIQQQVNSDPASSVPDGGKWQAWYLQSAYRFPTSKWEPVIRYGKFDTPLADQDQQQWAFGLDYWLTPSAVAQIAYEFNWLLVFNNKELIYEMEPTKKIIFNNNCSTVVQSSNSKLRIWRHTN